MTKRKPVMLVLGAGAGIGGHVAQRFAAGGYHAVLCRRSDEEGLQRLVAGILDSGGEATGMLLNAVEEGAIEDLVFRVERDIGPALGDTPLKTFELGWRMATFGLFRLAQALLPLMEARGSGTLLVTSATAAVRGNAGQHSHAAAMGGRRMLCQTLNAEFAPKGIHVAHILIDGPVEAPNTLGKLLGPERFAALKAAKSEGKDELILPSELAETYWHIAHQHRSAWSHEVDIRPFKDKPWWNS